jgi:hypothetical protein
MSQVGIEIIAKQLNELSPGYDIGDLQQIRRKLKGLSRIPTKKLFNAATISPNGWAFHVGGRTELQFNIGFESLDDVEYVRHGVAFSLETSQALPSINVLIPKIKTFNEFIAQNDKVLSSFRMWHFDRDTRSSDYEPSVISEERFKQGFFLFLGTRQRRDDYDVNLMLSDFDRLLPLYKFVESSGRSAPYQDSPESFHFAAGHNVKRKVTTASTTEAELSVALREGILQEVLYGELCREFGSHRVRTELPNGSGGRIDVAVEIDSGYIYFEIKAGQSLQWCIRNAIGQLLEYSHWPGSQCAESLFIVGEVPLDVQGRAYLKVLREKFSIPIKYRQVRYPE